MDSQVHVEGLTRHSTGSRGRCFSTAAGENFFNCRSSFTPFSLEVCRKRCIHVTLLVWYFQARLQVLKTLRKIF